MGVSVHTHIVCMYVYACVGEPGAFVKKTIKAMFGQKGVGQKISVLFFGGAPGGPIYVYIL